MVKLINKIFFILLALMLLVLLNVFAGGGVAVLLTGASWVSILFGVCVGLFLLWVDVQAIVFVVLYIKSKISSKSINLNSKQ